MPMSKNRQYRAFNVEVRNVQNDEESYIVEGYAATWDRYELYDDIYEQFTAECFKETDIRDVIFQYNHEGMVYARMSNGSLTVTVDDRGLYVRADLGGSEDGRKLYEAIKNGLVTKMSWGFIPGEYEYDRNTKTVIHKSVKKIFDVSAVSIPANEYTDINARSFADGVIGGVLQELQKREKAMKELELKLKLASI